MKSLKKYSFAAAAAAMVFGTLGHFLYEFSSGSPIVGMFFPVNESTWEHLKLLFTPVFIIGVIEWFFYGKKFQNFFPALFVSVLGGMLAITASFYTYTGILGKNYMAADIMTFVIGIIAAYYIRYKILKSGRLSSEKWTFAALAGFALLFVFAGYSTFNPLRINIFKDPVTGTYGI